MNENEEIKVKKNINDTHREKLLLYWIQHKLIEIQGWLLLMFFMCLHSQLRSF